MGHVLLIINIGLFACHIVVSLKNKVNKSVHNIQKCITIGRLFFLNIHSGTGRRKTVF